MGERARYGGYRPAQGRGSHFPRPIILPKDINGGSAGGEPGSRVMAVGSHFPRPIVLPKDIDGGSAGGEPGSRVTAVGSYFPRLPILGPAT